MGLYCTCKTLWTRQVELERVTANGTLLSDIEMKKYCITPNPMREFDWTVDLFDMLIRARIYMFRWGESPPSGLIC